MSSNWEKEVESSYPHNKQKKISKKYKELVTNVLKNVQTYFETLNTGVHPETAKKVHGFVHNEGKGLYAIDQRPPVGGPQLRLYVYPDLSTKILHIVAIGDKNTQRDDVKLGHKVIKGIQNG